MFVPYKDNNVLIRLIKNCDYYKLKEMFPEMSFVWFT